MIMNIEGAFAVSVTTPLRRDEYHAPPDPPIIESVGPSTSICDFELD
jgi:hypothetical protein